MSEAIGIRFDEEMLKRVDVLGEEESVDRSTMIRKLVEKGFKEFAKEKAAESYKRGEVSLTGAARRAGLTLWDFQHYLIDTGFVSSYSIDDLQEELEIIKKVKKIEKAE